MITIYKTNEQNKLKTLSNIEPNCWINVVKPTIEEIEYIHKETQVDQSLMEKLLDDEELPRIEISGNATMIVIDAPFVEDKRHKNKYVTMPLGIISSNDNYLITISLKPNEVLEEFASGLVREFYTYMKTRFVFQLFMRISVKYLNYLKMINQEIESREHIMSKTTENKELIYLLGLQKSLVFFITSLKENDIVLEKIAKGNILPVYDDDLDLLEDAMIENKQGIEMANIYREILSTISDTYATVISNNLNRIMKILTGMTIVISVPTMISSFLGMNVPLGNLAKDPFAAVQVFFVSILLSILITIILKKKDML